jgi:hypothetical protein
MIQIKDLTNTQLSPLSLNEVEGVQGGDLIEALQEAYEEVIQVTNAGKEIDINGNGK